MSTLKWSLEGLAIGPRGDKIEMTSTHYSEPAPLTIEHAKASLEEHLWQIFPTIFAADPVRVEVHVNMVQAA